MKAGERAVVPDAVSRRVGGAKTPEGVQFCESCGVEIVAATQGKEEPEIDKLLESLTETKAAEAGSEGLDLDKEIVDELLDSLLVEEGPAGHFDCPLCGTKRPLGAGAAAAWGPHHGPSRLEPPRSERQADRHRGPRYDRRPRCRLRGLPDVAVVLDRPKPRFPRRLRRRGGGGPRPGPRLLPDVHERDRPGGPARQGRPPRGLAVLLRC